MLSADYADWRRLKNKNEVAFEKKRDVAVRGAFAKFARWI
jgi:hypothetical protein